MLQKDGQGDAIEIEIEIAGFLREEAGDGISADTPFVVFEDIARRLLLVLAREFPAVLHSSPKRLSDFADQQSPSLGGQF